MNDLAARRSIKRRLREAHQLGGSRVAFTDRGTGLPHGTRGTRPVWLVALGPVNALPNALERGFLVRHQSIPPCDVDMLGVGSDSVHGMGRADTAGLAQVPGGRSIATVDNLHRGPAPSGSNLHRAQPTTPTPSTYTERD